MSWIKHLTIWFHYIKQNIKPVHETPEVKAGRRAEDLLRNIIHDHKEFNKAHSFAGKRIYNTVTKHRNEIDLIIATQHKLYIIECKNWSGELREVNGHWIQRKIYQGEVKDEIRHENMLEKNSDKMEMLVNYLREQDIDIHIKDCTQKIIFMQPSLHINSTYLAEHPDIITPDELSSYLDQQPDPLGLSNRFFNAVMQIMLQKEDDKSETIMNRLGTDYDKMIELLDELPTWDKVALYGTQILSGDILRSEKNIIADRREVPFDKLRVIQVQFPRNPVFFFLKLLLNIGKPINLKLMDRKRKFLLNTEADYQGTVKILPAGSREPLEIPIMQIKEIIYGKALR